MSRNETRKSQQLKVKVVGMDAFQKERRRNKERRSGIDRRLLNPPEYPGIERRIDPECRSCKDRRREGQPLLEHQSPFLK